ncbi:Inner membrane transport permease YbhR [Chlamydiales bacterium STE3]|nr:Inner membrane transport permease YbhR [Chlamydiales bacterium STE3]
MFSRILALIHKEILAVWSDKKSRAVLIVPPLTQLLVFAFAATLDVKDVPIAILNRDNGKESIELAQRFHGSPTFSHILYLKSVDEIAPFINNQRGAMVLSIDEQFSRNLNAKKKSQVQIILDGRKSNTAQIIAGYANAILNQFNRDFAQERGLPLQSTELFPRFWFNPNVIYYWYNVPCLCGILTMVVGLLVTALSVARERELGTFDQLLVSPLLPVEILIGKTVPAIVIGMAEGTVILLVAIFFFKVPFTGSLIALYFSMFVFISSVAGVGLLISSLSATQQQAILGAFVFMTPAVLLSGFATPIENMPEWLQYFTYLNPLRYFLSIAKGSFLKAMPFYIVWENIWPMVTIAFFTLSAATWFFKKRLE